MLLNQTKGRIERIMESRREQASLPTRSVANSSPIPSAPAPEDFLSQLLYSQDTHTDKERVHKGHTHVSSLIRSECSRQYVIAANTATPMYRSVTGGHRIVWALGRACEAHMRQQIITAKDYEGVYGNWRCKCGATTQNTSNPKTYNNCTSCGGGLKVYEETLLLDDHLHLRGSPDIVVEYGGKKYVVEIKSTKDTVPEIQGYQANHLTQVMLYHHMLSKKFRNVADKVIIIYCTKKFLYGVPYKEFHIDVNDANAQTLLAAAQEKALILKAGVKENQIPPRTICSSQECTKARNCAVSSLCFGGFNEA